MKRSNAPVFWLPFGAGGMLAALIGPALVFVTGIGPQLGLLSRHLLGFPVALSVAQSLPGKVFLFAVVSLFLWHAAHRIYHTLHDLGVKAGPGMKLACYAVPLLGTLAAAYAVIAVGF